MIINNNIMNENDKIAARLKKLDPITGAFVKRHHKDCAFITTTKRQIVFYIFIVSGLLLFLAYRWDYFIFILTLVMAFWYFGSLFFRGAASLISLLGYGERKVSVEELKALNDADLPIYTIFLPLYKEANIAKKIIHNMAKLDYPKDKLDIKLLLESDDIQTLTAVKKCSLPTHYDLIVVPDFQPKTKPRACNFGLARAKGEYCVIFDAEDCPEPDQLRKAVAVFKKESELLACIQAKLNYYNAKQNLLTKLFTIEYSTAFDLFLPGVEIFNVPLPLGGTSNHFRTAILKDIGGWDPFNVTEDCDLGIRLYKHGYRTALLDSTTWEEANSNLWNWIRQRSRWVKGFLQTHLAHMRHPLRTVQGLGLWGTFGFYMSVGASSFMMLTNVFYWIIVGFYLFLFIHGLTNGLTASEILVGPHTYANYSGISLAGFELQAWPLVYWGAAEGQIWVTLSILFCVVSILLFLANFMFIAIYFIACWRRKYYFLLPYCLLMPFYWLLISFGAWKGFIQLFTNPFYWEKTIHGLDPDVDADICLIETISNPITATITTTTDVKPAQSSQLNRGELTAN
jgi:cellulose synthase/poly-beta-1,6-N-acetylglucosamine synthase-like glycosyltransferase